MFRYLLLAIIIFTNHDLKAEVNSSKNFPEKIITIIVNESGTVFMGVDTLEIHELGDVLQDRLFKSYSGTGKMPSSIKLQSAPLNLRKSVIAEINKAQHNALSDLCMHLHKRKFDGLTAKQQEKIKRKFPVLFQTDF
jgi:hypothetical protein